MLYLGRGLRRIWPATSLEALKLMLPTQVPPPEEFVKQALKLSQLLIVIKGQQDCSPKWANSPNIHQAMTLPRNPPIRVRDFRKLPNQAFVPALNALLNFAQSGLASTQTVGKIQGPPSKMWFTQKMVPNRSYLVNCSSSPVV